MAINDIPLYKQLNTKILEMINPQIEENLFSYEEAGETSYVEMNAENINQTIYSINEQDNNWDVARNNLRISRSIRLSNIDILFSRTGITNPANIIGIAAHLFSRTSNYQETIDFGNITSSNHNMILKLEKDFPKSSLKGKIDCNIFLYLKECHVKEPYKADFVGLKYGDIDTFSIIVDGEGSMFPILEVEKPGEPLWTVYTAWTDIYVDPLDLDNVRVELNKKHPGFTVLMGETKPSKMLLVEVFSAAMTQIIFKALETGIIHQVDNEGFDSIASAVGYWISTFNIDVSNLDSINYSVRKKLEEQIL